MKKKIAAMLAGFLVSYSLSAELPPGIAGLFTPEAAALLGEKGEATAAFTENGKLRFFPALSSSRRIIEKFTDMKPMFGVEVCLIHRVPGLKADAPEGLVKIYNTLSRVSSLKGLRYYSATRRRMRELFKESYRIDGPGSTKRLPDQTFGFPLPEENRIYSIQEDSTFGKNVFRTDYWFADGCIVMIMENAATMWYGVFPLVDPGNLAYLILVYPSDDYLVFYSVVCIRGANPFGILESRTDSFYYRIKALDDWFKTQSGLF